MHMRLVNLKTSIDVYWCACVPLEGCHAVLESALKTAASSFLYLNTELLMDSDASDGWLKVSNRVVYKRHGTPSLASALKPHFHTANSSIQSNHIDDSQEDRCFIEINVTLSYSYCHVLVFAACKHHCHFLMMYSAQHTSDNLPKFTLYDLSYFTKCPEGARMRGRKMWRQCISQFGERMNLTV